MASNVNLFGTVRLVLGADVAADATFTTAYPTGTTQASFLNGLATGSGVMVVNDNNRYAEGSSGFTTSYGASLVTVTNKTGATLLAGSAILLQYDLQDGNSVEIISIPINLAAVTAAGDVVTDYPVGFAGKIESWAFLVTQPVTTAAKLATLNLEIGTTDLTGGTIALTSAAATPLGKIIQAAAITGANTVAANSVISVEASAVTAFAEGAGVLLIRIRKTRGNSY